MSANDTKLDEYTPLVRSIVTKLRAEFELPADDDLMAAGYLGLVEADSRFDPTRGVLFSTFAYYRVRGAVIDHVRKSTNLSRRAYARIRFAEAADGVAEEVAQLRADDPSVRTDLAATVATVDETIHKLTAAYVVSCLSQDSDSQMTDAETCLINEEAARRVQRAVESLPDRERALVVGHYFDGRRFDEVAAELGVSKSWASRIHGKALLRLRAAIEDD